MQKSVVKNLDSLLESGLGRKKVKVRGLMGRLARLRSCWRKFMC